MRKTGSLRLGAVGLALLCGCSRTPKLYVYNWSYYIPASVLEKFEQRYDVTLVYDLYSSNEEMYAKLKAGGAGYDVCFPSGDHVSIMIKEGMLLPINKNKIPNFRHIDESVVGRSVFDPGCRYSVPYVMGGSGIAVNKKFVKEYDRSWNIFSRSDLKGRMTMLDDMREVLGAALRSLGHSVNTTDTAKLRQARDKVAEWQRNLLRYDAESFGKAFAAGEVWVVQCYAENVFTELDSAQKADVDFFIPREGGSAYIDNMVILQNARNPDLAHAFINFIHEPAIYAEIVDSLSLPCSNTEAAKIRKRKGTYELADLVNSEIKEDLGENVELYNRIWQQLRIGK